jgi:hypothetical protein
MFDVEVKGFDEVLKGLKKMEYGLSVAGINSYCERIKKTVLGCGITRNMLILEAEKGNDDSISIKCQLIDGTKKECLKQAIRDVLPVMPITTKPFFEGLLEQMEND